MNSASSQSATSSEHDTPQRTMWRYGFAMLCGVIAMSVIPPFGNFYGVDLVTASVVIRGLLCGVAVGLALAEDGWRTAVAAAAVSSVLGWSAVLIVQTGWISAAPPQLSAAARFAVVVPLAALVAGVTAVSGVHRYRWAASVLGVAVLLVSTSFAYGVWGPLASQQREHVARLNVEVPLGAYDFDGDLYMRLAQELKRGGDHYQVFLEMIRSDPQRGPMVTSAFNVRQPALFWVFALLPGPPAALLWWFMAFWCVVVAMGFVGGFDYGGASAGVAVGALLMMYGFPAVWLPPQWFVFPEFWAGGLLAISFCLLWRGRPWSALVLLLVAVSFREFAVLLAPAYLAWWWLRGPARPGPAFPVIAAVGPVLILAAHLASVPRFSGGSGVAVSAWLHGSFAQFMEAVSFHWAAGIPGLQVTGVVLPVLAGLGATLLRSKARAASLALAVAIPCAFLLFFGAGNDTTPNYWGAFITPLFISVSLLPFALATRRLEHGTPILSGALTGTTSD